MTEATINSDWLIDWLTHETCVLYTAPQGHFKVKRVETACLRTHYCESFPNTNALDYMFCIYNLKLISGGNTPDPRRSSLVRNSTQNQFPLGSSAFPSFLFYEITTDTEYIPT